MKSLQNDKQSHSILSIKLIGDKHLSGKDKLFEFDLISFPLVIDVNANDPISSIIDITGLPYKKIKVVHERRILCPALSFSFYRIQNNDTLLIVRETNNYIKSTLFQKSTNIFYEPSVVYCSPKNKGDENETSHNLTNSHSDVFTDLYRFKIESNHKKFRKLCTRFYELMDSDAFNNSIPINTNLDTILPEKATNPSTDFLPTLY